MSSLVPKKELKNSLRSLSWEFIIPCLFNTPPSCYYSLFDCRWYSAKHDKDEGVEPHYHLILRFDSQRSLDSILNTIDKLELAENQKKIEASGVQKVKYINGAIDYLIHKNHPHKYQYSPAIVGSNDPSSLARLALPSAIIARFKYLKDAYYAVDKFENSMAYVDACAPIIMSSPNAMQAFKNIDTIVKHFDSNKNSTKSFASEFDGGFIPIDKTQSSEKTENDGLPF